MANKLSTPNYKFTGFSKNIKSEIGIVNIGKFVKKNTNRVFFTPVFKDKRITKTMFPRMYDAEKVAIKYIAWKGEQ